MKQIIYVLIGLCFPLAGMAQILSSPDVFTRVTLSSSNPNRLVCVNGNVNDVTYPAQIPLDGMAKEGNFFVSYKFKDTGERIEYVTKTHDIHVTCGGEIYSMTVQPTPGIRGEIVWLGDPNKASLEANAKMLREKSIEDLYVYLIMSAFHNNYAGNVSVSEAYDQFPTLVKGIGIELIREMILNGAGLRLKEFVLTGPPGANVQKERFLNNQLSSSILALATYPPVIGKNGQSRLFIVEKKL